MREKLKLSSDGGESGTKNSNDTVVAPIVGSDKESAFDSSLESGGRFCVGAFGWNLASVAVKMF
jgi:hypothetical protein